MNRESENNTLSPSAIEKIKWGADSLVKQYNLDVNRVRKLLERWVCETKIKDWIDDPKHWLTSGVLKIRHLEDAFSNLGPEKAFKIFETQDLEQLLNRLLIADNFLHFPLYTFDDLKIVTEKFISFLKQNKVSIIETGLPSREFYRFLFLNSLSNLYFTKVLTIEDKEIENPRKFIGAEDLYSPQPYTKVSLMEGLSSEEAKQLESKREFFFDLKIRVLEKLLKAIANRDAVGLWDQSFELLTKVIDANEADLLFQADERYEEFERRYFESLKKVDIFWRQTCSPMPGSLHAGGLSDLLFSIGYWEYELSFQKKIRIREALGEFAKLDIERTDCSFNASYFEIINSGHEDRLMEAIEIYSSDIQAEKDFWDMHKKRVKNAIGEFEFEPHYADGKKIKFKDKEEFESRMRTYAAIETEHLRQKGMLTHWQSPLMIDDWKKTQEYIFRKEGDYWTVAFEGKKTIIKHTKGMELISYLLQNPGKDFHVMNLVSVLEDQQIDDRGKIIQAMHQEELEKQDLSINGLGDAGEAIDPEAKKAYRLELESLEDAYEIAIDTGFDQRAKEIADKIELIKRELARSVGKGGKIRKDASQTERARQNVYRLISSAKQNIQEYNPDLWKYLDNSINTGEYCSYNPDRDIDWIFS